MSTKFLLNHSDLLEDLILNKVSIKKDWAKIKSQFNIIYPLFFIGYLKKGIHLSVSEERYLLLEKLGMDTQLIASILEVLPESIYTLKYRMRRKIKSKIN